MSVDYTCIGAIDRSTSMIIADEDVKSDGNYSWLFSSRVKEDRDSTVETMGNLNTDFRSFLELSPSLMGISEHLQREFENFNL